MAEDAIEPLVTECPNCHTRFRVTEAQLTLAGGRVRCGACLMVFTGTDYLVFDAEEFPEGTREEADAALDALLSELSGKDGPETSEEDVAEEGAAEEALAEEAEGADAGGTDGDVEEIVLAPFGAPEAAEESAVGTADLARSDAEVEDTQEGANEAVEEVEVAEEVEAVGEVEEVEEGQAFTAVGKEESPPYALPDLGVDPEDLVLVEGRRLPAVRWWVPVAIVGGLIILTAQVLWYQFDAWVQDPGMRPIYERLCPMVGCDLPVLKDINRFYTKELVVRSHPSAADALMVDALIVNDAPFAQPFPVLELRFSAMGGQLVAARRFRPEEYLAGELEGSRTIPARTPVHVSLEIEDPGSEAVNYVMVFR